jgi:hypothetical protein
LRIKRPGCVCQGQLWEKNVDLKPADMLTDVANCNLRNLTWVASIVNVIDGFNARLTAPTWMKSTPNTVPPFSPRGNSSFPPQRF